MRAPRLKIGDTVKQKAGTMYTWMGVRVASLHQYESEEELFSNRLYNSKRDFGIVLELKKIEDIEVCSVAWSSIDGVTVLDEMKDNLERI